MLCTACLMLTIKRFVCDVQEIQQTNKHCLDKLCTNLGIQIHIKNRYCKKIRYSTHVNPIFSFKILNWSLQKVTISFHPLLLLWLKRCVSSPFYNIFINIYLPSRWYFGVALWYTHNIVVNLLTKNKNNKSGALWLGNCTIAR